MRASTGSQDDGDEREIRSIAGHQRSASEVEKVFIVGFILQYSLKNFQQAA